MQALEFSAVVKDGHVAVPVPMPEGAGVRVLVLLEGTPSGVEASFSAWGTELDQLPVIDDLPKLD
jgi:hypothetical protein